MQEEWEIFVSRMVKLAVPQITPGEARQIIYFLAIESAIVPPKQGRDPLPLSNDENGDPLIDTARRSE